MGRPLILGCVPALRSVFSGCIASQTSQYRIQHLMKIIMLSFSFSFLNMTHNEYDLLEIPTQK